MTPAQTEAFVGACRALVGTPFKHQGRLPAVGVDCAGLVIVAAQNAGVELQDDTSYGKRPDCNLLLGLIRSNGFKVVSLSAVQPGDLLVMKFDSNPQHVAVVSEVLPQGIRIIHAAAGNRKVVEHYLDPTWRAKVSHAWRLKE